MAASMGLEEYAKKRHFDKTPEPKPDKHASKKASSGGFFCVQRHDATRLHYDFRLEVNGVLVSWAVPKGPSLDPGRKALAMKVEDHPLDYGTFEGNIPQGNYGAGSVMLWDQGTYELMGDLPADKQIEKGDFKFALHGTKLKGLFAIVRMKNAGKGNEWLLIKKKDEFAVPGYDIDQFSWSIASKRTQDEIAKSSAAFNLSEIPKAREGPLPKIAEPMLATAVSKPPAGSHWIYEIKWDGVRALCHVKNNKLTMESRRGIRCEDKYPELHSLAGQVNAQEALLDGEVCVLDGQGRGRFELIQPRISASQSAVPALEKSAPATLFLFDVLYVDGFDLRGVALSERKRVLNMLVVPSDTIRLSESFEVEGEQMFEAARTMGLEGILAKDRGSSYEFGRSSKWLKLKVQNEQEFVVAGFTKGERDYFGALVLGLYENGVFRHVGQVGTGFDQDKMSEIHDKLKTLVTKNSPFSKQPKIKEGIKNVTWVKPTLVCQVRFLEWTREGILRAPVFVALREDKEPAEAVQEAPVDPSELNKKTDGPAFKPEGNEVTLQIDGRPLKFTNLKKVFYPKDGWTKRDILEFYYEVSPWLLPHLKGRPLSLKRYPNGIHSDYFFQKNASSHFPSWMHCEPIKEGHPQKTNHYPVANDQSSLLYLVNLGCVDHNPWMSRVGSLGNPDWMLLDLDPVEASYDQIVEAALLVKEVLAELGLRGYAKTTGGDGMHIYVPMEPIYSFEQVRGLAELISQLATEREPNLFTTPRSVEKRKKKRVYFDYLQIGTGKTISAPYVLRAYDGAPVATPLDWKEVKRGLRPDQFRLENVRGRFAEKGDLFGPVLKGGQRIEKALEKLEDLTEQRPK